MIEFEHGPDAIVFTVRVIPRSSRSGIAGDHDGILKVKLSSPPVDGRANDELVKLLARSFGVSKAAVEILAGQTSKVKRVRIIGCGPPDWEAILKAK